MTYTAIRGMSDLIPPESSLWQALEAKTRQFLNLNSINEIRTPILEHTDVFLKSIGQETDIVNKEMYAFEDRKGRSLALRPEMTASVVRAAIENKLISSDETTRLYYIGPMFRAERPQAGRRRQFHQVGVEVFGKQSVYQDVETITVLSDYLSFLGLSKDAFTIKINSIGTKESRKQYHDILKKALLDLGNDLPKEFKERMDTNILRIFDSKNPDHKPILEKLPKITDHLSKESQEAFDRLQELLAANEVPFVVDPLIVRGLDYYQDTVFEVTSKELGAQDAIAAGGRYDGLVKDYGGPDVGGIGFAIGIERLLIVLEKEKVNIQGDPEKLVYLAHSGSDETKAACGALARELTAAGVKVVTDYVKPSIKAQMRQANKLLADPVLILGEDELSRGEVALKEMSGSGEQITVKLEDAVEEIKKRIS